MSRNPEWQERRRPFEPSSSEDSNSTTERGSWRVAVGVFIIQLTVPVMFYSYGVILTQLLERHVMLLWHGLLPPVTYIIMRCFADPVCRNVLSGQNYNSKTTATGGVLLITGGMAINGISESALTQVLTLGVLGGLCTSIVINQAEAVLHCHFPTRGGFRQCLSHIALALGQFVVPLFMNGFIKSYGVNGGFVLQSGLVLHGLVGAMLLAPPNGNSSNVGHPRRPRTYTVVNDVEMVEFSRSLDSGNSGHSPLLSTERSWKNPGNVADKNFDICQTSILIHAARHKTATGVDILPEIPEECEDGDGNNSDTSSLCSDNNWNFPLRNRWGESYSGHEERNNYCSRKYLQINKGTVHSLYKWKNTNIHYENNQDTAEIESLPEEIKDVVKDDVNNRDKTTPMPFMDCSENVEVKRPSTTENQQNSTTSCFRQICQRFQCSCCTKNCFYNSYIAVLNIPNDLHFYMIVPFLNAMKVPGFIPSVLLCMILRLCPVLFATFAPYLTRTRIAKSTFQEGAFTVSVAAFGLLCFTLVTPCLSGVKITGQKFTHFFGCLLIAAGLYLLSSTRTHSYFILGCACFGFGIGASTATVTTILEVDLGMRDFVRIEGPLDVVSGFFILLTSVLLGFLLQDESGVAHCFLVLIVLQLTIGLMWIFSLLKPVLKKIHCLLHSEWHAGGDFLTPS